MSSEGWKEQRENNWVVWLTEQGGEIFLGLAPTFSRVGRRRFCVLGEFQSDGPNGVGIWMDVDLVQEIEVPSNTVTDAWQVEPAIMPNPVGIHRIYSAWRTVRQNRLYAD
jgi:hypothetical protein